MVAILIALTVAGCGVSGGTTGSTGASGGTSTGPQASLSPISQNFGDLDIGVASSPVPITVTNNGDADLVISAASVSPSQFAMSGPASVTVAPGQQVTYNVTFTPTDATSYSGTFSVTTNAQTSTTSATLNGKGHKHQISASPTSVTFGNQTVNSTSSPQTVTLTNNGNNNLVISGVAASPAQFSYSGPSSVTVAPGAKVSYNVTFTPAGAQSYSGSLSFTSNNAFNVAPVALSGTGTTAPSSQLTSSPTSLAFGNVVSGSSSTKSLSLTNSGTASVTINQVTASGAGFSVSGLALPATLAAGQSTSVSVTFAPTTIANASGAISVVSNASNSPLTVALSGAGVAAPVAQLAASPATLAFGNIIIGSSSTQLLVISNSGNATATISQINVLGAGFSASGLTPPLTIAAGQSKSLSVTFAPSGTGSVTGSVSIVSDASNSPTTSALTGSGVAQSSPPVASINPLSLNFGNQAVNTTSAQQNVVVTNTGGSSLVISSVTISPSQFTLTGPASTTVAAGSSVTYKVSFTPTNTQSYSGSLIINSNASPSSSTVTLAGTGTTASSGTICGDKDDGLVHTPPSYSCANAACSSNPFPPPPRGGSYVDPQYGCTVTRLTDAVGDRLGAAAHHNYGTVAAINSSDTYVAILLENGSMEIVDTAGNVIVPVSNMPGTNTQQLPWDINIPTRFYYASGSAFKRGDITGLPNCASTHNCTITSTTLHDFAGSYSSVQIPAEEDISDDGDHIWLVGGTQAFLYTLSTNTVGPAMNVGTQDSGGGWHKIQIMPSNRMLMTWGPSGSGPGAGQEVYNTNATLAWHMFNITVHTDCGRDLNGNEVCVVGRIPDTGGGITGAGACPTWTGTQDGGVDIINMTTHAAQCLVDINWADTEISFRDGSPGPGWVFITFFRNSACSSYSCFDTTSPTHLSTNWASQWVHFAEEGILVRIDNNNTKNNSYRLFHTRSRSSEYYWAIPRGSISRSGKIVVFDSNFDISNTGLVNYTDVYLTKVQ